MRTTFVMAALAAGLSGLPGMGAAQGRDCTFTRLCAPEGCFEMDGFTQSMQPLDGVEGGWIWITEVGATEGRTVSPEGDNSLVAVFPPSAPGAGTRLVTIAPSGSVVMSQQGVIEARGEAVANSYFGLCAAQG